MTAIQPEHNRSFLSRIFISPDETRLRAGWRLLIQSLLMFLIGILIFTVGIFFGSDIVASQVFQQIANLAIMTGSIYIARRWLDKRSFESLGLKLDKQTWIDILAGIGITFVQMSLIYFVMNALGWITFEGFAWQFDPINTVISNVLIFLIGFTIVGWNEELLSRGYHLQTIAGGTNLFWGVIISSVVFGLLHLANPTANWISTTGIFLGGIFFAYGYIRTKQLWLPMGMHLGWNFFEGVVFGFPVSGLDIYPLTRIQVHGPEVWTGGAFGPEAGLIVIPALVLGAVLIYFYTANRTT